MFQAGLVLEGGGMRGLYTCGVLDFFIDQGIEFQYVIGVSAGACNAVSYLAGQRGRNFEVNTAFVKDWRYMSIRNLIREKSYFGMDFIFNEIPNKHVIFDYAAFNRSKTDFVVVTTECETGKPYYFTKDAFKDNFDVLKATSSLPMLSPMVKLEGKWHLDGGLVAPIPLSKSRQDGNAKNVVILTRDQNYKKSPQKLIGAAKIKYRNFPNLVRGLEHRHLAYNATLEEIDHLEKEGQVFVIRPGEEVAVDRLEKDTVKLKALYQQGYEDAKRQHEALLAFLR